MVTRRADVGRTVDLQAAALVFDQRLGQGQAETGAVEAAAERGVDLVERAQRCHDLVLGHADAGVDDGDRGFAAAALEFDLYRAAVPIEFDRVGQGIEQDALCQPGVGDDVGPCISRMVPDGDAGAGTASSFNSRRQPSIS